MSHPTPSVKMEKGLSCQGCHVLHEAVGSKLLPAETLKASGEACEACHGRGFSKLLLQWEQAAAKEIAAARQVMTRAQQELATVPEAKKKEAASLLAEAAFNIAVVEKGKAVHNMAYSQELLQAAASLVSEAMKLIGSNYQPPGLTAAAGRVPTSCAACHQGVNNLSVKIFGPYFSHGLHLEKTELECQTCHALTPQHGKLVATKSSCASCHHDPPAKTCHFCHEVQSRFFVGGKTF